MSRSRDATSTVPPFVLTYTVGGRFLCFVFALFNTTPISMSANGDGGCAGFGYMHTHTAKRFLGNRNAIKAI